MHVLLIGSYRPLVKALKQGLEDEGFTVDASFPGNADSAAVPPAAHDAVVLDLVPPESAGLSRLHQWRRTGLTSPVLVLTAPPGATASRNLDAAADDWLAKPFDLDEFFARLRALRRHA
jgi:DNA-binding response OmpR family regulator